MLSMRHDRRMLKLGQLLETRQAQIEDHDSGRRRLSSEVGKREDDMECVCFVLALI